MRPKEEKMKQEITYPGAREAAAALAAEITAAADGWTEPSNLVMGDSGMYLNRFAG